MTPTLLLIHHSHTDIGYTDPQGVVEHWQAEYLRQALRLVAEHDDFAWQCEGFRQVELFLATATDDERAALLEAVRGGRIGLSASWANLNELADQPLLERLTRRASSFAESTGLPLRSALTADINGHSWGFSAALLDAGVENLFACVHTHHGRYPLDGPQTGFWWEAPDGRRLLVWSGEHYHLGNELGLAPGAVSSYLTKDDCDAHTIFHDWWTVAERRIPRYLERLRAAGAAVDPIPVMISGLRSDNAPPSAAIAEAAARWNREHGDVCSVAMSTVDEFFDTLRNTDLALALPIHRGDWPDWWSDGLASEPESTRLFREAQRRWVWLRSLLERHRELPRPDLDALETRLALYAEHTFGHSDSVTAPWHLLSQALGARKRAYAAVALDEVTTLIDHAAARLGAAAPAPDRPLRFRVENPLDIPVSGIVPLIVGHEEYRERDLDGPVRLRDLRAARILPWQRRPVPRGMAFEVPLQLAPGAWHELELAASGGKAQHEPEPQPWTDGGELIADAVRVAWRRGEGITAVRCGDRSLLRPGAPFPALTPLVETTPTAGGAAGAQLHDPAHAQAATRAAMGLARKGPGEERALARCTGGRVLAAGPVSLRHQLRFAGAGLLHAELELAVHRAAPVIEAALRLQLASTWDPTNLYLPLPFAWPGASEPWLFKSGAALRPWRDQLPGTVTDWSCLQEGFAWCGRQGGLAVAMLDAPLLWLGPLEGGPRRLMGDAELPAAPDHLLAWLAANHWETNFRADLGGFMEYRFAISWGADLADPTVARARCRGLCHGLRAFRLGD